MRKRLFGVVLALALVPASLWADEGSLMLRIRAVNISPADKSDYIPGLVADKNAIHVSSKTIPEVDISYFFTENLAAELILTYPQEHDVTVAGLGKLGTFKELPPTLTLQYHFIPDGAVRPYVGVGVNLTLISSVKLAVPGVGALDLDSSSVGLASQLGCDFRIGQKTFLNLDVKYVGIDSDVKLKATGAKVSHVWVDPWLFGGGIGFRF